MDELIALLRPHGVALLVDVRRFPGSRRHPHFGREALAASLAEAGITSRRLPQGVGAALVGEDRESG
ncbi:MAG TPA: DUF488 family protein [Longimicrobium sp.]|nr:DUF488 family protein [Longimicrobium sp.]